MAAVTSVQLSGLGIAAGNGNLNANDVATLTVNFDAAVVVNRTSGSPTLTLNTGARAYYTGGTGTTALTFQYVVSAGQNTPDLSVTAMSLNGSTIQNSGVNATLTGAVTNPVGTTVVDNVAPTATVALVGASSRTSGTPLQFDVVFSEPVTGVSTSGFSLTTSGVGGASISSVVQGVDAAHYTVNVVSGGGNGTVRLDLVGQNIKDLAGNAIGGGNFLAGGTFSGGSSPTSIAKGDLNVDGKMDYVVSNTSSTSVIVGLGSGTGGFPTGTGGSVGVSQSFVALADFNADGKLDVLTANSGGTSVSVLLGTGTGSFGAATGFAVLSSPRALAVADFNLDGKLDVAVSYNATSTLSVLLGNGTGGFGTATTVTTAAGTSFISTGDVNNDGKPDLVTGSTTTGNISVQLGTGTGTFGAPTSFATGGTQTAITLGDLNADGKLDLVAAISGGTGRVLLGTGTGSFGTATSFSLAQSNSLALADLDGDNKLDLAATSSTSQVFSRLIGTGTGSFNSPTTVGVSGAPAAVALADIDSNGRLDALIANSFTGSINTLTNFANAQAGPTVTITNAAPTDLALSDSSVREEQSAGLLVGTLTTTDSDTSDSFTYSLVTGTGSTDNANFRIVGNQLQTNAILDYESKASHSIRIRTTDVGGLFSEKQFTIQITNEFEAESPSLTQQITPASTLSDTSAAQFGKAVAISSDYYLIGAPEVNAGGFFSPGQAFLYSAVSGQLLKTFNNPNLSDVDQMGYAVALSGNTVVLGAWADSVGTVMAGRAMIFDAVSGSLVAAVDNPTPADSDSFGISVATGGGLMAIGADGDDPNSVSNSGAVHIYSSTGTFQRTILNPSPAVGSRFGRALAMDGTTLAAASHDGVYIINASTGAVLRTITNPGTRTDSFGSSVAISGSRVAVGASNALVGGVRSGNVRIYDINTGVLLQTYSATSPSAGDGYGTSVSIDSQSLMVGAPQTDINGVTDVGAVYLYNLSNGTLRGGMSNPTPNTGDNFGASIGLLGVKSIVGSPYDDSNGTDQGNVYVFTRVAPFGIGLSSNTISENNSLSAVVGTLSASSVASSPISFALVNGTGGADNSSFTIVGNQLKANAVFNYEVKSSYSILIEATDAQGFRVQSIFTVNVQNANEAPTQINLSSSSIAELKPANSVVGSLSSVDPDQGDTFTYSLTTGSYPDNAFFDIVGTQLVSRQSLDFETKNQYVVEVRSTDAGLLNSLKTFTITVNNVNQAPLSTPSRYDLRLVADLNNTIQDSNPSKLVELGGYSYFTATSLSTGRELYRANLSTGQTELVTDLLMGSGDANPQSLVVMGSELFFTAQYSYIDPNAPPGGSPETRFGIWKTDGTASGTQLLSQIEGIVSLSSNPRSGYVANGRVLFFVGEESSGEQLWSTTGLANGTSLIKTFSPFMGPITSGRLPSIVSNGLLYFNREVDTGMGNHSLWRTDGTSSGTFELRHTASSIPVGLSSPFDPSLTAIGSTVFFVSYDASTGTELWKTTGTVGSTQRITDINPGVSNAAPNAMISFSSAIYFSANDGSHNRELWKTDGITTTLVKDINPSSFGDGLYAQSEMFTIFGGRLYFSADSGNGLELWRTDGSGPGTALFTSDGVNTFIPQHLIVLPTKMLIANTFYGTLAEQLWSTDGTQAGNQFITSSFTISSSKVVISGSRAYFGRTDATHGNEPWVSDGTAAGTYLLADVRPGVSSGLLDFSGTSQGFVVFGTDDGTHGLELGVTDGTTNGTRVIDVARGTPASNVTEVASIGSDVYIATKQGLYVTQTNSSSTTLLTGKEVSKLTVVGSKMFFSASASLNSSDLELWVTDGTAGGTKLVYDVRTGTTGSNPEQLVSFGGLVYFVADDGVHGKELWRSSGSPNDPLNTKLYYEFASGAADGSIEQMQVIGTHLFILAGGNLYVDNNSNSFTLLASNASSLMPWNNIVYFSGYTADTGHELWRTDGTASGTYLLKDIVPGTGSSYPGGGVVANEDPKASRLATTEARLVFRASDVNGASQLFATNGITAATVQLTNAPVVVAGTGFGLVPFNLKAVGNQVYFQGYSQTTGLELWTSDGTQSGTHIVKDLRPGVDPDPMNNSPTYPFIGFSNLKELTAFRDRLYFSADSITNGRELWVSDGTAGDSYLAADIRAGIASGSPSRLLVVGNSLYIAANTDEYGVGALGLGELFRLNESPYLASQSDTIASGGSTQFRLYGIDNDGDSLTYQVATLPLHGNLSISGNIATYTANSGYTGSDSFTIRAFDGSLYSDASNFELSVVSSLTAISFASSVSALSESSQAFVADVVLSNPATDFVSVPYAYGFGIIEYQGSVYFAPGQSTAKIVIPITNDVWHSSTLQQIEVTLQKNPYFALGSITQRVETIQDDDLAPKILFVDSSRTYSEADGTFSFDVALSNPTDQTVTANISLSSSPNDIVFSSSNPLTFLPGQMIKHVTVHLTDDSLAEVTKYVWAGISSVTNATVTPDPDHFRSVAYIKDNDISIVTLSPAVLLASEGDQLILTATRVGGNLNNSLDVGINKLFGNTVAGDYSLSSSVFHFGPGDSESTIQVTLVDDGIVEGYERLMLGLVAASSYVQGDNAQTDISVLDNDSNFVTLDFGGTNSAGVTNPSQVVERLSLSANWQIIVVARLSQPSSQTITVPVKINDGTLSGYAKLGEDFQFATTDFVFAPGVTEVTRQLTILNDLISEPSEKLTISLAPSDLFLRKEGALSDAGLTKTLAIIDDDYTVDVTVPKSVRETGQQVQFTVSLNSPPLVSTQVELTWNTSMTLSEFQSGETDSRLPLIMTFNPGDVRSRTTTILLNDDSIFDGTDTLTLSAKVNASQGFVTRKVEITDNESKPTLKPTKSGLSLADNGGRHHVQFELDSPVASKVVLPISFGGSAKRGQDFNLTGNGSSGYVTVEPNTTIIDIEFVALDNLKADGDKIIDVTILPVKTGDVAIEIPSKGVVSSATIKEAQRPPAAKKSVPLVRASDVALQTEGVDSTDFTPAKSEDVAEILGEGNVGTFQPGQLPNLESTNGIIKGGRIFFDSNFNGSSDFLDLNGNGRQDDGEPLEPISTSDLDGVASLDISTVFDRNSDGKIDSTEGRIASLGGVDTSTNLPRKLALYAPTGVYAATTISTLLENLIRRYGIDVANGIDAVAKSLRIGEVDIANGDSIYQVLAGDQSIADLYSKQVQVFGLVSAVSALFGGPNGDDDQLIADHVYDYLADRVHGGAILDLASTSLVGQLLNALNQQQAAPLFNSDINVIADIIASSVARIQAIKLADYATPIDFIEALTRSKKVIVHEMAEDFRQVAAGTLSATTAASNYTGANFDARVSVQVIGQVIPTVIGVSDAIVREGNNGTRILQFRVDILGDHDTTISADFSTVDGTALDTMDYSLMTGTLTWAAHDLSSRTVSVQVAGDSTFEMDEYLSVVLTGAVNAVLRRPQGLGYIINDDSLTVSAPAVAGTYSVFHSIEDMAIAANGDLVGRGFLIDPISTVFSGNAVLDNRFDFDFSADSYRADSYTAIGGAANDLINVTAGQFQSIAHIMGASSGTTVLRSQSDTATTIQWSSIEGFNYLASSIGELIVQIPSNVTSVLLGDANLTSIGTMRISSPSGQFAPFEFNNPASKIVIVRNSGATDVTTNSMDPGFAGTIEVVSVGVQLSNNQVVENAAVGTPVGQFNTQNPILGSNYQVTLVPGVGSTNNNLFTVDADGKTLRTAASFDYELSNQFSVRVRVDGPYGTTVEDVFAVGVSNVNEAPVDVSLSNTTVTENRSIGTAVGNLQTTDPDSGIAFTYMFVSGLGDSDNSAFTIDIGGTLRTNSTINFENKNRVRSALCA